MRFRLSGPLFLLALGSLASAACGGQNAVVERAREVAEQRGCFNCHTTDGTPSLGPTWKGLYGSTVELDDGSTVVAEEEYLRESILQPSARTVRGFPAGLMESAIRPNSIPEEEVTALIAYIRTLR